MHKKIKTIFTRTFLESLGCRFLSASVTAPPSPPSAKADVRIAFGGGEGTGEGDAFYFPKSIPEEPEEPTIGKIFFIFFLKKYSKK